MEELLKRLIDLSERILEEEKQQTRELEDLKNLFLKYDTEELLLDEELRDG